MNKTWKKIRQHKAPLYMAALLGFVGIISYNYVSPVEQYMSPTGTISLGNTAEKNTIDVVQSAEAILSAAEAINSSVSNNVLSMTTSAKILSEFSQSSGDLTTKMESIVPTTSLAITKYTTVDGDNAKSVGAKFGISAQTVRWANNLKTVDINSGTELLIPSVDGVVYVTKADDTVQSIAEKYHSTPEKIMAYNVSRNGKIAENTMILVPGGQLDEKDRPEYSQPTGGRSYGGTSGYFVGNAGNMSAGNRYAYGYCTWGAYELRLKRGMPIGGMWGNATSWEYAARAAGFRVDHIPEANAVFGYHGGYGHVGVVDSVDYAAGTMVITDMNGIAGYGRYGTATVPINNSWFYIH